MKTILQTAESPETDGTAKVPPFHLVVVVWGRAYTHTYLNLVLPTHLSPGNVPALAGLAGTVYKIYTTGDDAAVIRADQGYRALAKLVMVQIVVFSPTAEGLEFDMMIVNHRRAIVEANAAGAAMVALSPDAIFADGAFAALRRLRADGKRLVLVTGLRARLGAFMAAVRTEHKADFTGALTLAPRDLMRLALTNLHPVTISQFWDSPKFNSHPSILYWWVQRENPRAILARCFHLHPLLIDPEDKCHPPQSSIDDDYVHSACPDPASHHVVTDSDEIACVEISRDEHLTDSVGQDGASVPLVALWCLEFCHDTHRKMVRQQILLHDGAKPSGLAAIVNFSGEIVASILHQYAWESRKESLEVIFGPVLRWRGWLWERHLLRRILRYRLKQAGVDTLTLRLDACRPSDLVVVYGTVFSRTSMRVRLDFAGRHIPEKTVSAGHFRWVIPSLLAYGPTLHITVAGGNLEQDLRFNRVSVWRTLLHHLRHDYQSNRPDPLWLEWTGLGPGHRLQGPCMVRVIPHRGVTSITLEFQTDAESGAAPACQRVTLPLNPKRPADPVPIDLPGSHRLISVSCAEKPLWRAYKEFFQVLSVISNAIFTRPGRRRRTNGPDRKG